MRVTPAISLLPLFTSFALSGCSDDGSADVEDQTPALSAAVVSTVERYSGRYDGSSGHARASWPGTAVQTQVTGTDLAVRLDGAAGVYFEVLVDGERAKTFVTAGGDSVYPLASWTQTGEHLVEIYRRTEGDYGNVDFLGFESSGDLEMPALATERRIEYIGDSLTCGYGIEGAQPLCQATAENENAYLTYAAVAARSLKAEASLICASGKGVVRNADGGSEATMSTLYDRTLTLQESPKWDFVSHPVDVAVINLGTNDFYGGANADEFVAGYRQLIARVRANYADALIVAVSWSSWGTDNEALVARAVEESGDGNIETIRFAPDVADGYGCNWHTNTTSNAKLGAQLSEFLKVRLGW